MSDCRRFRPLLEVFLDGELPTERVIEVEEHLAVCACCVQRVQLEESLRRSLRAVVTEAVEPCAGFEARLRAALSEARAVTPAPAAVTPLPAAVTPLPAAVTPALPALEPRAPRVPARRPTPAASRPLGWRAITPIALAAAFSLMWAAEDRTGQAVAPAAVREAASLAASPLSGVEQLVDQLVEAHANGDGSSPALLEPADLERLDPEVGVPVRAPVALNQYGLRFEGGSVVPMKSVRAASVRYRLDRHRVTLYVYDARRFPLRATLEPRVVRNQPVYVGTRRGYSVAAAEQRGVGYAVASDLDDRESAELVAASLN